MSEVKLARDDLTVLLNCLYDLEADTINVSHPSNRIDDLVRFDLGDAHESKIRFTKDREDYGDARDDVRFEDGEAAHKDLPDSRDYANIFMASGVVDAENHDEVLDFLETEGRADLNEGHEPVFAGFDTNVIPWRLQRVFGLDPSKDYGDKRPLVNGFVLASGVRRELDWDAKHDKNSTRQLVDAFGDEFKQFVNQPKGSRRVGRLGIAQYNELRNHNYGEEIRCERGDDEIVKAYDNYTEDRRRDAVLLSNDYNFVERAKNSYVPAQRVGLPDSLPRKKTASWYEIADTLYLMAVVFGVVSLPKATVYGVWTGKDGREWQDEMVKIDCRSPKLQSRIERNIEILDAYRSED